MADELKSPSRCFAYWDYYEDPRELVHRRSRHRIALEAVLSSNDAILRCLFDVHDKPWGNAKTLDELVELLGTVFGAHKRMIQSDSNRRR